MFKLKKKMTFNIALLVLLVQVPLACSQKNKFDYLLSFDSLISGEYGQSFEKFLASNVPFFTKSGKLYRELQLRFLNRYTHTVRIKDDGFIFLPGRTYEMSDSRLSQLKLVEQKIQFIKNLFTSLGIDLEILIVPNRSSFFSDTAYRNKTVPSKRRTFYRKFYEFMNSSKIEYTNFYEVLDDKRSLGEDLFFRGDHHWTFKASEIAAKEIYPDNKPGNKNRKQAYEVNWSQKKNGAWSLIRKLGIRRNSIENLSVKYPMASFTKVEGSTENGSVFFTSASYGKFGFAEFLSNQYGFFINSEVISGQGALYVISSYIQKYLNYGLRHKKVYWLFPEYHIESELTDNIDLPLYTFDKRLNKKKFSIVDVEGARVLESEISPKIQSSRFSIKYEKNSSELYIRLKAQGSGKSAVISSLSDKGEKIQSYYIIFDKPSTYVFSKLESEKKLNLLVEKSDVTDFKFEVLEAGHLE